MPLHVSGGITIPDDQLQFTYVRSSGPGGQNVNKVNSKAVLRFAVLSSNALSEPVRARFRARYGSRLTADGELILTSDRYRDQGRNTDDCRARLAEMIAAVVTPPKRRRPTKPTRTAVEKRLQSKRTQSARKQSRGRISHDD